jgi:hypothetical protein
VIRKGKRNGDGTAKNRWKPGSGCKIQGYGKKIKPFGSLSIDGLRIP